MIEEDNISTFDNIPNIYTSVDPSYCKKCSNTKEGILIFHQKSGNCIEEVKSNYNFCPNCGYNLKQKANHEG